MGKKAKWNETPCPKCKQPLHVSASRCPHCHSELSSGDVADREREHRHGLIFGIIVLGLIVLMLAWCGSGGEDEGSVTPETALSQNPVLALPEETAATESESTLTGPQQNAVRSAGQYLNMGGFSRDGLIDQLSSDAGEGYVRADAVIAVDSLTVDWNEQAVRSARQYLNMSGFSCKGLIDQLSSDSGEKFTRSQATYGAEQAGAC